MVRFQYIENMNELQTVFQKIDHWGTAWAVWQLVRNRQAPGAHFEHVSTQVYENALAVNYFGS